MDGNEVMDTHDKELINYQKRLQRKINALYRGYYPHGKFRKEGISFVCLKTNAVMEEEAMTFLYTNGYVRLHLGTCLNLSYYILDTAPHGLNN